MDRIDISKITPNSGRMVREDGSIINIADALSGDGDALDSLQFPIEFAGLISGRMIREDGSIINIADLIASGQIGGGGGGGGTTNYNDLENKPTLNGVEVSGNKTSADYKISAEITQIDHDTSDTTFELPPNGRRSVWTSQWILVQLRLRRYRNDIIPSRDSHN